MAQQARLLYQIMYLSISLSNAQAQHPKRHAMDVPPAFVP